MPVNTSQTLGNVHGYLLLITSIYMHAHQLNMHAIATCGRGVDNAINKKSALLLYKLGRILVYSLTLQL